MEGRNVMDELDMVKLLDTDSAQLGTNARRLARERLLRDIAGGKIPPRVRPRRRLQLVTAAGVALGLLLAVVAVGQARRDSSGPPVEPRLVPVSATEALSRAAARARAEDARLPIPRDEQYIYTREVLVEVRDGGAPETFVDEIWRSVDGSKPSRISERGKSWISPPMAPNEGEWPPHRYTDLLALPRDPQRLLLTAAYWPASPPSNGGILDSAGYGSAYTSLVFLLHSSGVMPPGLRAAILEPLALVPGVVITEDVVDGMGRHGIGIFRPSGNETPTWTLILDASTYDYLGYTTSVSEPGGAHIQQSISLQARGVVDRIGQRP
jgi:hypothetical protein